MLKRLIGLGLVTRPICACGGGSSSAPSVAPTSPPTPAPSKALATDLTGLPLALLDGVVDRYVAEKLATP